MSTNKREATKLPTVKDNVAKDIEPNIATVKKEELELDLVDWKNYKLPQNLKNTKYGNQARLNLLE